MKTSERTLCPTCGIDHGIPFCPESPRRYPYSEVWNGSRFCGCRLVAKTARRGAYVEECALHSGARELLTFARKVAQVQAGHDCTVLHGWADEPGLIAEAQRLLNRISK